MKKIKVAHMITMLEMGGAQGNTLFTAAHLDRESFETILICGPGGILDEQAQKTPHLKTIFVPSLVRPIRPLNDFLCLIRLTRILREEKPDIVHTHSSKAGILGRIAASVAGVPVILHSIHGFGFNPYQKFFVRWLFIFLEKWIAKITHRLIAVSQSNIETGLQLGIGRRDQYTLIRSGVDIQKILQKAGASDRNELRKKLNCSAREPLVLSVGPFKIQKDPVSFVRCAARVLPQVPGIKFLWVGDGELRPQVEKEIDRLRVQDSVRILGWREDIPELLNSCDVFVLTSLWEGLPRSAVEALIVGKPVVAFAVDGTRLIVTYKDQRAKKDAFNRKKGMEKLREQIQSGRLTKESINNRGYNKFLILRGELTVSIDESKVKEDERWDGLKGYITNTTLSAKEITENYVHLWQIEKAFRISKTDLRIRPIHHYLKDRIEAHICIAFAAYTIYKELELLLQQKKLQMSPKRAAELTHTMYEMEYILPGTHEKKRQLLKMDQEQQLLYDLLHR